MSSPASLETKPAEAAGKGEEANGAAAVAPEQPAPTATADDARAPQRGPIISRAAVQAVAERLSWVIRIATVVIVAVIALGIFFYVLDANMRKWLVSDVENAAKWFAGPFQNTFMLSSAKLAVALNWGIAILVYAIVGRLLAKAIQDLPGRMWRNG